MEYFLSSSSDFHVSTYEFVIPLCISKTLGPNFMLINVTTNLKLQFLSRNK